MITSPGMAEEGNMASNMSLRSFSSRWLNRTFFAIALEREAIVL
jgi:hypothetical protein